MSLFSIDRRFLRWLVWAVIALANVALLVMLARSPAHSLYDETWFLNTVDLVRRDGAFTRAFLLDYPGTPGPTYTVILATVQHVVSLTYPWIRLLNVAFLAASVALIWLLLRHLAPRALGKPATAYPLLVAGMFTALPTVAVSAGMTLTEMPGVFFVLFTLALVLTALHVDRSMAAALALALVAGVVAAVAIMDRQNYLLVVPCLLLLARADNWGPNRNDLVVIIVTVAVAICLVGPIFLLWGGLIPPTLAANGRGFSIWNGVLSAGYAGLIAALISPDLYGAIPLRRWRVAVLLVCALVVVWLFGAANIPARSYLSLIKSDTINFGIGLGFALFWALLAVAFLASMGKYVWDHRADRLIRFCGCVVLLGVMSNAKVTVQFSSRYVFVFVPFLLMALAPTIRPNWHLPIRLAVGVCLGLASLAGYYGMR